VSALLIGYLAYDSFSDLNDISEVGLCSVITVEIE